MFYMVIKKVILNIGEGQTVEVDSAINAILLDGKNLHTLVGNVKNFLKARKGEMSEVSEEQFTIDTNDCTYYLFLRKEGVEFPSIEELYVLRMAMLQLM